MATKGRAAVFCIGNDPVNLNLRCALLNNSGWRATSSGSGHDGVLRFQQEPVEEAALIISELKPLRPSVRVVMLVTDCEMLAPDATKQADTVLGKAEEGELLIEALQQLERKR